MILSKCKFTDGSGGFCAKLHDGLLLLAKEIIKSSKLNKM